MLCSDWKKNLVILLRSSLISEPNINIGNVLCSVLHQDVLHAMQIGA